MNLKIDLKIESNETVIKEKIKEKQKLIELKNYEPTWEEVWDIGYMTHTGRHKPGIYQTKLTDLDRKRLQEVKTAIERGEIGTEVGNLKKFTKAHALRLYDLLRKKRRQKLIDYMIENKPSNYLCVDTPSDLQKIIADLSKEPEFSIDVETTGLNIFKDIIIGISISLPRANYHVYIPIGHKTGEKQLPAGTVLDALKPILEDSNYKKVLHNAKFDLHMFLRHGIRVRGVSHDTMIAMHVLNENEPSYALKVLATKYGKFFGFVDDSATYEELFGNAGFENIPLEIATVYACKDTHLTWQLYNWQLSHFERLPDLYNIYKTIENPLIEISVHMEQSGFLIDLDFAKKYGEELRQQIADIEKQLQEWFGDINLNSPQQLQTALYDRLQLPDVSKKRSTDKKVLKQLKDKHPAIAALLEYRALTKLLGTYIEVLPQKMQEDGRLHGSFYQSGTVTGRFSSDDPNLQNQPKGARKLVVAGKGKVILGIDFSQIEPRVLAHMSGDKDLQKPYLLGQDLYSTLASQVFNKPIEECGDGSIYRNMMKVALLAVMYGTSIYTLAEQLSISVEDAEKFIEDFYSTYQDVARFVADTERETIKNGYTTTRTGRKRRFTDIKHLHRQVKALESKIKKRLGREFKSVWEEDLPYSVKRQYWDVAKKYFSILRQARNFRIQGYAAEIMKLAMIAVYNYIIPKGWKMLATVHDEILLEVDESITREEVEEIEYLMTSVVNLDVPLKVDTEIMRRWGEGVPKDIWFGGSK